MKTITLTLEEIADFYYSNIKEVIKDMPQENWMPLMETIHAILRGDTKLIRKAFVDGDTMLLVLGWDEDVNEVRILDHSGELLMVVCGKELNY